MRFIATLALALFLSASASARWKAEYAQLPQSTRDWYDQQTTTPETRARLKAGWYKYCCAHADTVKARFTVNKVNGTDQWFYQVGGSQEWHLVPADTVQPNIETPDRQPVLFVDATGRNFGPVCFFPGVGGI
jgi:hypothetical protein